MTVTDAVPNRSSGNQLNEQGYPAFFNVEIVEVEQGIANLNLEDRPVFVEPVPG